MADSLPDETFARLVNQMGIVTLDQIEAAMRVVEASKSGTPQTLAEVLVSQGIITETTRENVEKRMAAVQAGGVKQIGPYKIIRKLGQGGMGAVYLADDTIVGRKVAIKVLPKQHAADQSFLSRFRREAKSTGQLNHINIVTAFTTGEEMGVHYYVMEYCDGEPLDAILKREKSLSWEEALDIIIQVTRGLKHAHDNNLIHRDIKPSNIFLTKEGVAKILDLGLSKSIGNVEQSFNTQSGIALGTPHYISPEQARADKVIDGRTDIYSLGATLYHLLTGQTPFDGETPAVIMMKHLSAQLPNPQDMDANVPEGVVQVVQRMMAKEPEDRYPGCEELLRDLQLVREGKPPVTLQMDENKSSVAMRRVGASRRGPPQKRTATMHVRRDAARHAGPGAPAGPNRLFIYGILGSIAAIALISAFVFTGGKTNDPVAEREPVPPPAQSTTKLPPPVPQPTVSATPKPPPPADDPDPHAPLFPFGAKPVNVFAEIDPDADAFIGKWRVQKGALVSPNLKGKAATIIAPYRLPRHYRIDVELAYVSGSRSGFIVGMTNGVNPFAFTLDDGKRSYLITMDGHLEKPYKYHKTVPETTFENGPLIKDHKRHYLSLEMREKTFTASLDNKLILNWKADYSRLGPTKWNRVSKQHLSIAAYECEWRVTKLLVLDLEGKGEIVHVDMSGMTKELQ